MTGCHQLSNHKAKVGEELEVRRFGDGSLRITGDRGEVACIPHEGCQLGVRAVPKKPRVGVEWVRRSHIVWYTRVRFCFLFWRDIFLLPNARQVKLKSLEGFKFTLLPSDTIVPPVEDVIVTRARAREAATIS